MRKGSLFWRRALKSAHVALCAAWLGAALCLLLLVLPGPALVGDGLAGVTYGMTLIDDLVIVPTAAVVVLTGIGYGIFTKWGFVRFDWVVVKWVATLAFIGFGALCLGPWVDSMHRVASARGAAALEDPVFVSARRAVLGWGAAQVLALVALVFVSIYKPWGRRAGIPLTR